jgi:hypothetical protein
VLVYVANEYPTVRASVGALKASVVRLYGIVVILSGWVRVGCARLSGVHSSVPTFLWAGLRGVAAPAGPFLYLTASLYHFLLCLYMVLIRFLC